MKSNAKLVVVILIAKSPPKINDYFVLIGFGFYFVTIDFSFPNIAQNKALSQTIKLG
jgi:hypothetical protein